MEEEYNPENVKLLIASTQQVLAELQNTSEELAIAKKEIAENKDKVDFYDAVTTSDELFGMSEVAKVLAVSGWGRNKIFAYLREKGVLRANNQPYQPYVDKGFFKLTEQEWTNDNSGETMVALKTEVTQKGIDYIRKLLNG